MLHKCANPGCAIRFRQLRRGKLFQIESEYMETSDLGPRPASARKPRTLHRVERYWLCDECAARMTLTFDQTHGVTTVPLPEHGERLLTSMQLRELQGSNPLAARGPRWGIGGATWTN